jgi:diguanylate cyclase (GGDEF)-like protein
VSAEERALRRWPARVVTALVLVGVIGAMAGAEIGAQSGARRALEARFVVRASTAASFAQADASFTLGRERTLATALLTSQTVTQAEFESFLQVFNFSPGLLLNSAGQVLDVSPYKVSLIGTDIAPHYPDVAAALAGHQAMSSVTVSPVNGAPVTSFTTPFDTLYGRRVVSGAYNLSTEPMGIYLRHVVPFADSPVYLLDQAGQIVTSSSGSDGSLARANPLLSKALASRTAGFYTDPLGERSYFVSEVVTGTPWHLVLTIPATTLFTAALQGDALPWIFLVGFGALAVILGALFVRALEQHRRLAAVAHIDVLTGIANRRSTEEALTRMLSSTTRNATDLGLLMIDVDHFKAVNDRYGHPVGDEVLKGVATRIRSCLRLEDVVGRWGGEEFMVLVSTVGPGGAAIAAERIRSCIAATPFVSSDHEVVATISIGVAVSGHDTRAELIARADAALYLAKETGRNQVVHAPALAPSRSDPVSPNIP